MENDLLLLHTLASTAFQNVTNLTPSIRQVVANAKLYQKSVHTTCSLAVLFIESLQNIANAAAVSEGSTKKIGEVLGDIIDAFKEVENTKLELIKLFIDEVIIPLESKAEVEINNTKSSSKTYHHENKLQAEAVEKAKTGVMKYRKRSSKSKKRSPKLEEKEMKHAQRFETQQNKLQEIREKGLRKALTDERRIYCFVAERMCAYGRGIIIYNNRISNFVTQKIPDWQQYISKPTELPAESERIIENPSGYKMGTVKKKIDKPDRRNSIKRGKSFSLHYPNKYSTYDGRASRGGSRPSLSALTYRSMASTTDGRNTPLTSYAPSTVGASSPILLTPPASIAGSELQGINNSENTPPGASPHDGETNTLKFVAPKGNTVPSSEYANLADKAMISHRSHSFTAVGKNSKNSVSSIDRTNSTTSGIATPQRSESVPVNGSETIDFATKLAQIQNQLKKKLETPSGEEDGGNKPLKAKYDHSAQDVSQLSFNKDDVIIPVCEPTSGWQYGENARTKKSGWFPAAYVENPEAPTNSGTATLNSAKLKAMRDASANHKRPPPVAKKSFSSVKNKRTVSSASSNTSSESPKISATVEPPKMSSSSSMPQMIHMLGEEKEKEDAPQDESEKKEEERTNGEGKMEAPLTEQELPAPTSPSLELNNEVFEPDADIKTPINEDTPVTMNGPAKPESSPKIDPVSAATSNSLAPSKPGTSGRHRQKSYDMPPPPPPPELMNGDIENNDVTFIAISGSSSNQSLKDNKKTFKTFGGK